MHISIIAAMAKNRVIGIKNRLPWHLPADLAHFKQLTLGKPIIMGRKTYESIGKPLPDRLNIIITSNTDYQAPGCTVVSSIKESLKAAGDHEEVLFIGGAKLYQQVLPMADRLYFTLIHEEFTGDTFFPEWDKTQWKEVKREDFQPNDKNPYPYSFICLERITS